MRIPVPAHLTYDPHQITAVHFIEDTPGNIIVADEMGFGKTVTVIGWLNYKRIKSGVLIICKASGVDVWSKHLAVWHMQNPTVVEYHPDKPLFMADILICHYHWLSYQECAREIKERFDKKYIIMDEAHTVRKVSSARGRYLYAKNGIINQAEKVIATTGTPLFNRVEGMYSLIKGLRPDAIDNMTKFDFGVRYCGGYRVEGGEWNFSGASNIEELSKKLTDTCMIRRTEKDLPTSLPTLHVPRVIRLSENAKSTKLVEAEADYVKGFKVGSMVNDDNEELATLRRLSGESKVDQAARYILALLKQRKKIVVFAYHRSVVKGLHEALKGHVDCIKLIGGMPKKKAALEIERFQAAAKEVSMVIVASIGGFSDTITLNASALPIFVELSYIWEENRQAIKRLHRRGQLVAVHPVFLVFDNFIDNLKLKINMAKIKTSDEFEKGRAA